MKNPLSDVRNDFSAMSMTIPGVAPTLTTIAPV
jgi:hypothetical protein